MRIARKARQPDRSSGENRRRGAARREKFRTAAGNRKRNRQGVGHLLGGDQKKRNGRRRFKLALCQNGDSTMMVRMAGISVNCLMQRRRCGQGNQEQEENGRHHRQRLHGTAGEGSDSSNLSHLHGLCNTGFLLSNRFQWFLRHSRSKLPAIAASFALPRYTRGIRSAGGCKNNCRLTSVSKWDYWTPFAIQLINLLFTRRLFIDSARVKNDAVISVYTASL